MTKRQFFWFNIALIILISFNLRAPITAIGPVADLIERYYGMNGAQIGLLTSLPLFAFAFFSFVAPYLHPLKALLYALLCILIGLYLRSYGLLGGASMISLLVGTLIVGAGIAIANVLMPSFVKAKFPHQIPKIMGVYSLALNVSGLFGIAFAIPLAQMLGLLHSMAFFAIFALLALFAFIPQIKNKRLSRPLSKGREDFCIWQYPTAWKVTFCMGFQCSLAYCMFAWYPTIIAHKGFGMEYASYMMLFSQCIALPASFFGPMLLGKIQKFSTLYVGGLCSLYVIGFGLLVFFDSLYVVWVASFLIGIPMGAVFGIVLLLISSKASRVSIASKLSGMVQGVGYFIGAFAPYVIGALYDWFGSFSFGLLFMAGYGAILLWVALLAQSAKPIA